MLDAQLEDFQDRCESPLIDFTVDGCVDVDEDVLTSETRVMTDTEIIARVTQSQYDTSDGAEDDNGDEEEDVHWEMSPSRKYEIRQAFEVLQTENRKC